MAKPKERSVTLRVVFTMKRQGEEKGEAAFPLLLKRVQTVLGEKYNVLRLEVLHGDVESVLEDDDMIYQAGERWGEARVNLYGSLHPEEPEPEPEPDLEDAYEQAAIEADEDTEFPEDDVEAEAEADDPGEIAAEEALTVVQYSPDDHEPTDEPSDEEQDAEILASREHDEP